MQRPGKNPSVKYKKNSGDTPSKYNAASLKSRVLINFELVTRVAYA